MASTWPPLRSALLTTASKTAIRRPCGVRLPVRRPASILTGCSGRVASPEAVGADTQVPLGVDRASAERAVGTPRLDHQRGTLDERAGGPGLEPHHQDLVRLD